MRRYSELKLLQRAGRIEDLRTQVPFQLLEPFTFNDEKVRGVRYVADFVYHEGETTVIEDCKGFRTDIYRLKRKMLLAGLAQRTDTARFAFRES